MKKLLAVLSVLTLVCLSLTGCVLEAVVIDEQGNDYPIYMEGGIVPTEGMLTLVAVDDREAEALSVEEITDYDFVPTKNSKLVFNPINGGKKLVVKGEDMVVKGFEETEDAGAAALVIGIPYELVPGEYYITLDREEGMGRSMLKFKVYDNGDLLQDVIIPVHSISLPSKAELDSERTIFIPDSNSMTITVVDTVPTGDASNLMMWAALVGAGCIGLAVVLMKKRSVQ